MQFQLSTTGSKRIYGFILYDLEFQLSSLFWLFASRNLQEKSRWITLLCSLIHFFESMMIGTLWTFYDVQGIFLAAVLCMVLFTTMTVVSWLTKKKPHILLMLMFCCLSMSIFVMFFLIFFTSRWIIIVCCFVMLAIGCIYVYIDVELIINKYGLEYDEYIIGALLLYQDLIMIFSGIIPSIFNINQ